MQHKNRPLHFSEQHDNAATPTMKSSECGRITAAKASKVTNPNTGLATLYTKYAGIKDISPFTTDKAHYASNFAPISLKPTLSPIISPPNTNLHHEQLKPTNKTYQCLNYFTSNKIQFGKFMNISNEDVADF